MSEPFTRIPALARRLSDALERAHVPYAIGGALAYSEWGIPRSTKDLDLNVFLGEQDSVFKMMFFRPRDIPDVQQVLATQGAALDRAYIRRWLVDMVGESD